LPKTKQPEPAKNKQKDLEGKYVAPGVSVDDKTTVALLFKSAHFLLSGNTETIAKIRAKKKPADREDALYRRVRPRPDVEDIPKGAKVAESSSLVHKALTISLADYGPTGR